MGRYKKPISCFIHRSGESMSARHTADPTHKKTQPLGWVFLALPKWSGKLNAWRTEDAYVPYVGQPSYVQLHENRELQNQLRAG